MIFEHFVFYNFNKKKKLLLILINIIKKIFDWNTSTKNASNQNIHVSINT